MNLYIYGSATLTKRSRTRRCVITVDGDVATVHERSDGKGSALTAEWGALFDAISYVEQADVLNGVILSDNESLIRAVKGIGKIRSNVVKSLKRQYDDLRFRMERCPLVYVPSTSNFARRFMASGLCLEFNQEILLRLGVTTVNITKH